MVGHDSSTCDVGAASSVSVVVCAVGLLPPAVRPSRAISMIAESPTPHLPRGAGGPLRRAAGRVSPAGPPVRTRRPRVRSPGQRVRARPRAGPARRGCWSSRRPRRSACACVGAARSACGAGLAPCRVVFVPLERADDCRPPRGLRRRAAPGRRAAAARRSSSATAPAPAGLLSAHRAHRCADVVLLPHGARRPAALRAPAGGDAVTAAGLTAARGGRARAAAARPHHAAVGARLCVSSEHGAHALPRGAPQAAAPATGGRCAPCSSPALSPALGPGPEVCPGGPPTLPRNRPWRRPPRPPILETRSRTRRSADGPRPFASTASAGERMSNEAATGTSVRSLKRAQVRVITVFFMIYILVSGGSFGIEDMVSSSGPGLTLLLLVLLPVFWACPWRSSPASSAPRIPGEGGLLRLGAPRPGRLLGLPDGLVVVALHLRRLVRVRRARRQYLQNWLRLQPAWSATSSAWAIIVVFALMNIIGVKFVALSSTAVRGHHPAAVLRAHRGRAGQVAVRPVHAGHGARRALLRHRRRVRPRPRDRRLDVLRLRVDVHALGRDPQPAEGDPPGAHAGGAVHHPHVRAAHGGEPGGVRPLGHLRRQTPGTATSRSSRSARSSVARRSACALLGSALLGNLALYLDYLASGARPLFAIAQDGLFPRGISRVSALGHARPPPSCSWPSSTRCSWSGRSRSSSSST